MQITGSIQGEKVEIGERERMQRLMRDFIGRLRNDMPRDLREVGYKIYFWRPYSGAKIDSLIEFRSGSQEAWYARASGADPWRAFNKALGSLNKIIMEMEFRGDARHVVQFKRSI